MVMIRDYLRRGLEVAVEAVELTNPHVPRPAETVLMQYTVQIDDSKLRALAPDPIEREPYNPNQFDQDLEAAKNEYPGRREAFYEVDSYVSELIQSGYPEEAAARIGHDRLDQIIQDYQAQRFAKKQN